MRIGCAPRPAKEPLLAGYIHLPGSPAHLTGLELRPWFGIVEPAELVGSRISEVSNLLGRIAELLHDRDAGIMPEAEINAVELIAAEVAVRVVRTRHRVELGRGLVACSNSPSRARVARYVGVGRNTQRIAAEAEVLRKTVIWRCREVVECVDAATYDVELLVEKQVFNRQVHQPDRLMSENLLDLKSVGDIVRQAVAGAFRG